MSTLVGAVIPSPSGVVSPPLTPLCAAHVRRTYEDPVYSILETDVWSLPSTSSCVVDLCPAHRASPVSSLCTHTLALAASCLRSLPGHFHFILWSTSVRRIGLAQPRVCALTHSPGRLLPPLPSGSFSFRGLRIPGVFCGRPLSDASS